MTFAADLKAALVASGAVASNPATDTFANGFATAILLWAGGGGGGGASLPIVLTTDVSGILPVANGGTGSGSAPAGGFAGLTALNAEISDRIADVNSEEAARIIDVDGEEAARIAADSAEAASRIAGDAATLASAATATAVARAAAAVYEVSFAAGLQTVTSTAFTRVGARAVDMSKYPTLTGYTRHVRLLCDVDKTSGATSGTVQLYDVTHAVAVTGTSMTTTSNANEEKDSGDLTVGTSAGNIQTDAARYELQMKRTGGVQGTDAVYLTNARLQIYYT